MSAELTLLADHGELVQTIPFVLPALLLIGALLVVRAIERKRDTPDG